MHAWHAREFGESDVTSRRLHETRKSTYGINSARYAQSFAYLDGRYAGWGLQIHQIRCVSVSVPDTLDTQAISKKYCNSQIRRIR